MMPLPAHPRRLHIIYKIVKHASPVVRSDVCLLLVAASQVRMAVADERRLAGTCGGLGA